MKTKSKALLLALCAVLLVVASVFGTLAYLTDTETVTNTFTVGQVHIKLDEAPVDNNGKATSGDRVQENKYKLLPGHEYDKDPMVTVINGSEESYVRMLVTVQNYGGLKKAFPTDVANENEVAVFLLQNFVKGWDSTKWIYTSFDSDTATYEFRYVGTVTKDDDTNTDTTDWELEPLFTQIFLADEVTNDQLKYLYYEIDKETGSIVEEDGVWKVLDEPFAVSIVAEAIQVAGFNTAADAWAEWNN